jgi:3-methylcrotonyl-CoA carboxylase beta subunit
LVTALAGTERWVDEITEPADTGKVLIESLEIATRHADEEPFRTGVQQV